MVDISFIARLLIEKVLFNMKNIFGFAVILFCLACHNDGESAGNSKIVVNNKNCDVSKIYVDGRILYILECENKVSTNYGYVEGKQQINISTVQVEAKPNVQLAQSAKPIETSTPNATSLSTINFKNCKLDGEILTCTK